MRIFALSDFHLSFAEKPQAGGGRLLKPMSVFGEHWEDCYERIYENCHKLLSADDWLLCAGDISWAMTPEETENDFAFLESLPCKIIITRGNHDYWWQGISRIRKLLPANCFALQNDALLLENKIVVAGTRGWPLPGSADWKQHDEKILQRESMRLRMSLQDAARHDLPIIAMLHYPPLLRAEHTPFTEILTEFAVQHTIYGHLHGPSALSGFEGEFDGVQYHNTAADKLEFVPRLIWED